MFNQDQIQEFKEAFNMIDHNRDGFIDNEDLHDMLASLGKDPTEEYQEGIMSEKWDAEVFSIFVHENYFLNDFKSRDCIAEVLAVL